MIKFILLFWLWPVLTLAAPAGARPVYFANEVIESNSSTATLVSGATFTGTGAGALDYNSVLCSVKTDQAGTLYMEFSPDNSNWDSSLSFAVAAGTNELHRLSISKKYFRSRFTNTSTSAQTYFRLQCIFGGHNNLTNALNSVTTQDADAMVSKTIDAEILIAEGKLGGYSITNKFGTNGTIDSNSTPEDIWESGGLYTGWATAAEPIEVFSASTADTISGTGLRTVRVMGLDANYAQISETISMNGTTGVQTSQSFLRAHTATAISVGSGGVNAGAITFRQATTTANIFLSMTAGRNQTNCSCFTVPAGKTAYMRMLHVASGSNVSSSLTGAIWTRSFGGPFRSRRPFNVSSSYRLNDAIFGGLVFTEKSDIIVRILTSSANSVNVNGGYDLILVDN